MEVDSDEYDEQPDDAANKRKGAPDTRRNANAAKDADGGYTWEGEFQRSWDVVREDESGSLETAVNDFERSKRRRLFRDTDTIQRGIIRHIFLVVDLSVAMLDKDLRPSRLELTLSYSVDFVNEFFDQNPISQMGIIGMRNGIAERISGLSGNPTDHVKALQNKKKLEPAGEPSLQNGLEMARTGLSHLPPHGSREVLVIFGSLTTCDPGNIHSTIDACVKARMRVNVIGLSAEMAICKEVAKQTGGTYGVVINEDHFKDLLFECVPPPAVTSAQALQARKARSQGMGASLILMGFPSMTTRPLSTLCSCHGRLKSHGFTCPRCKSQICEIPTDCGICGLTVVSSPHLARSYRHLFPVKNFAEVAHVDPDAEPSDCFACSFEFPAVRAASTAGRYACPKCSQHFCLDCDTFIHDVLAVCPGCQ